MLPQRESQVCRIILYIGIIYRFMISNNQCVANIGVPSTMIVNKSQYRHTRTGAVRPYPGYQVQLWDTYIAYYSSDPGTCSSIQWSLNKVGDNNWPPGLIENILFRSREYESYESNWQLHSIVSDNSLTPSGQQTITWNNNDRINWHMRMRHRAWKGYAWMIDSVYRIFDHPIIVILLIVYVKPIPV